MLRPSLEDIYPHATIHSSHFYPFSLTSSRRNARSICFFKESCEIVDTSDSLTPVVVRTMTGKNGPITSWQPPPLRPSSFDEQHEHLRCGGRHELLAVLGMQTPPSPRW